jgi:hypothetical protein
VCQMLTYIETSGVFVEQLKTTSELYGPVFFDPAR